MSQSAAFFPAMRSWRNSESAWSSMVPWQLTQVTPAALWLSRWAWVTPSGEAGWQLTQALASLPAR